MVNKEEIWEAFNSEWKHPIAGSLTISLGLGVVVFVVMAFVILGLEAPDWVAFVVALVAIPPSVFVLSYVLKRIGL